MAIPAGLEPATLCLEGRCSIQLSYGIILKRLKIPSTSARLEMQALEITTNRVKIVAYDENNDCFQPYGGRINHNLGASHVKKSAPTRACASKPDSRH